MRDQSKSKYKFKKDSEEIEQLKNQLARALADYDNLRKRVEREKESETVKKISKFLPVLDVLTKAQSHLNDQGIEITVKEFRRVLDEMGFEEIPVKEGDYFSSVDMEAVEIARPKADKDKNKVAEVVLPGWRLKSAPVKNTFFIVRPARVKVYGERSQREKELEKEMARGDYM